MYHCHARNAKCHNAAQRIPQAPNQRVPPTKNPIHINAPLLNFPSNATRPGSSTHILDLDLRAAPRPQIGPQGAPEELLEHLETYAGERGVVAAFAELVADEGV